MERTHITAKPIKKLRPVDPVDSHNTYKPSGFWYEVDGGWRDWCASEMPKWLTGKTVYRLDLDGERILTIRNVADFDVFDLRYSVGDDEKRYRRPDWGVVAKDFDGIEIAPYLWERRMNVMWYYGWDCASGVIWKPRGAHLELIGPVSPPQSDINSL